MTTGKQNGGQLKVGKVHMINPRNIINDKKENAFANIFKTLLFYA